VVNLDIREDTDRVGQVLAEIAAGIRADPAFGSMMLSDLQLWGVDKVDATMATLAGQIVCTDAGRWPVQREFNRRLKLKFQELDIRIANPNRTIVVQTQLLTGPEEPKPAEDERPLPATKGEAPR
jgi:small-conductance mechanosensitive channel